MNEVEKPFLDLPEALVEDMLSQSEKVGSSLHESFKEMRRLKESLRRKLLEEGILRRDSDLGYPPIPTTCGVDGSYAIERLLAVDFVACAAVAVEGLTPPSEKRFWESPHHRTFVGYQKHDADTGVILRGLTMEMEIELAIKAPHDVVFLDGSLTTPLIYMNQAVNKALELVKGSGGTPLVSELIDRVEGFLEDYRSILSSDRSDKVWVGVPKYTTKRELGERFGWSSNYDDRAVLSGLLEPGEFTHPIPMGSPSQPWHLRLPSGEVSREFDDLLRKIHIIYYRPHRWTPAFRIEVSPYVASNEATLALLLHGVKYQSGTPGILEPYPLYIADRMVKPLGRAMSALRQVATKKMIELDTEAVEEIFFGMHGYRSEGGR